MFAVVRTGSKQHRVELGSIIEIEKIAGEVGEKIELSDVLLVGNGNDIKVGQPNVSGAVVSVEILEQKKAPKVLIFKKIRRHGYHLKKGHRQQLTRIKVTAINA